LGPEKSKDKYHDFSGPVGTLYNAVNERKGKYEGITCSWKADEII